MLPNDVSLRPSDKNHINFGHEPQISAAIPQIKMLRGLVSARSVRKSPPAWRSDRQPRIEGFPSGRRRLARFCLTLTFQPLDLLLHKVADELCAPIRADKIVYSLCQSIRQANNGCFHSKRRSSHGSLVTGHDAYSIASSIRDIGY